jgi:hypothetical protein
MNKEMGAEEIRCWACWESTNAQENPLVRVCHGCKDVDLQYIHQQCINKYITGLIAARCPHGLMSDIVPFVADRTLRALASDQQMPLQPIQVAVGDDQQAVSPIDDQMQPLVPQEKQEIPADLPHLPGMTAISVNVGCTRCLEAYLVYSRRVSALRVLRHDKLLRVLMLLMTLCIVIMIGCCVSILVKAHEYVQMMSKTNLPISENDTRMQVYSVMMGCQMVDIRQWALVMMAVFSGLYTVTSAVVLRHCGGYSEITVVGEQLCSMNSPSHHIDVADALKHSQTSL